MVRFFHLFNYAEGVSEKDGEAWYLGQHVPQVKKLPGIIRYRSWKQWDAGIPYPSPGVPTPFDQFVRRTELCFPDLEQALKSVLGNEPLWAPSAKGTTGFREFECLFVEEEPQYNLLRDAPPQHYRYMSLPLWWPQGPPQVDYDEEIFIDSYCISYKPAIGFQAGEDWYLGHHTREGKQLPGMRHYLTWKTLKVTTPENSTLRLNRWARLTELGMSPAAYIATMVNDETRIRFEQGPLGPVLRRWLNISIKLEQVDDLLAMK
jgi:hypothetical protein